MLIIYILLNLILIFYSIKIFKRKVNPVSIFCLVWSIVVVLYEIKLIQYNNLTYKTWLVLIIFQIAFFMGNYFGTSVWKKEKTNAKNICFDENVKKRMFNVIVITTLISSISIVPNILSIIGKYGITNLIASISEIYSDRVNQTQTTIYISYFGPFIFISLIYTSIYIKRYGIKKFFIIPIVLTILNAISFGGRNNIIIAAICFIIPYILEVTDKKERKKWSFKNKVYLSAFILLFIVFFIFINNTRASTTTISPYISPQMSKIVERNHSFYKIYAYTTSPLGVLNAYLENPFYSFGANTFLPLYKQLVKVGINVPLLWSLPFYYIPISSNVGTYIMELIIDFHIPGALIAMIIFGSISGFIFKKSLYTRKLTVRVTNTIIMLCIILSFFMWYMRSINIWIVLIFGIIFGVYVDKKVKFY